MRKTSPKKRAAFDASFPSAFSHKQKAGIENQPINQVVWVHRDTLHANDYNPNHVAPIERALLKTSLLADGWTQPVVAIAGENEIVDGFHRWSITDDPEVRRLTDGLVPVVYITADKAHRRAATVRHNRARGTHGIIPMAEIVRELSAAGYTPKDFEQEFGMGREEVERLLDQRGRPEAIGGNKNFSEAWEPRNA